MQGNTIISPTTRNILWGISLQTVKEPAPQIGMEFVETDFQRVGLDIEGQVMN